MAINVKIERGNTRDIVILTDAHGDEIVLRSCTAGILKDTLRINSEAGSILDKDGVCDLIGLLSRWVDSGRLEESS